MSDLSTLKQCSFTTKQRNDFQNSVSVDRYQARGGEIPSIFSSQQWSMCRAAFKQCYGVALHGSPVDSLVHTML